MNYFWTHHIEQFILHTHRFILKDTNHVLYLFGAVLNDFF